jgi:hypothetical protein
MYEDVAMCLNDAAFHAANTPVPKRERVVARARALLNPVPSEDVLSWLLAHEGGNLYNPSAHADFVHCVRCKRGPLPICVEMRGGDLCMACAEELAEENDTRPPLNPWTTRAPQCAPTTEIELYKGSPRSMSTSYAGRQLPYTIIRYTRHHLVHVSADKMYKNREPFFGSILGRPTVFLNPPLESPEALLNSGNIVLYHDAFCHFCGKSNLSVALEYRGTFMCLPDAHFHAKQILASGGRHDGVNSRPLPPADFASREVTTANLFELCRVGRVFFPSSAHFQPYSVCDRCQKTRLPICIGSGEVDLCMACAEFEAEERDTRPPVNPWLRHAAPVPQCPSTTEREVRKHSERYISTEYGGRELPYMLVRYIFPRDPAEDDVKRRPIPACTVGAR